MIQSFPSVDESIPIYKWLRAPNDLHDILDILDVWEKESPGKMALLWRDNGTLICLHNDGKRLAKRHVGFQIRHDMSATGLSLQLDGTIYGTTDVAMAETMTFFWSLQHPEGGVASLRIECYKEEYENEQQFDFNSLTVEQLAQILDANPTRHLEFRAGILSAEQSIVLATRPYPLHLKLRKVFERWGGFGFQDDGTAFVDALECSFITRN